MLLSPAGKDSATVNLIAYRAETATLTATDGTLTTAGSGGTGAALTVGAAAVSAYRLTAATTTPQTGIADLITITQVDQYQNVTALNGTVNLTFGGPGAGTDGSLGTVTDNTGAAKNIGTTTTITFANGVSSLGGNFVPHKIEGPVTLTASDGSHTTATTGGATVALTVSFGADSAYRVTAASGTPVAGANDALTIKLVDNYQNVDTSFSSTVSLTFSGLSTSLVGTVPTVAGVNLGTGTSVTFVSGTSSGTYNLVAYKAESATLAATDGALTTTGTGGTGAALTVASTGAQSAFRISAASGTPTAGVSDTLTIAAVDIYGNTVTTYTGSHSLTFGGLSTAPDGTVPTVSGVNLGSGTSLTFASGSVSPALLAYRAEGPVNLTVTDGTHTSASTGGTTASLTVSAAVATAYRISAASGTPTAGSTDALTITQVDQYRNATALNTTKTLTFSGLGTSTAGNIPTVAGVNQGTGVSVIFANGVNTTVLNLIPYKAEGPGHPGGDRRYDDLEWHRGRRCFTHRCQHRG